ncbi:MAG: hypothetical protein B7Y04_07385 [Gallionellales bacterium 24-53-125]|jgi:hypothetical protein|nr:MAG: hypothetical protein B7Y04_07385 [Gallionellales bacterium 24-53-125]OZB09363.1 MAG: hypothetical protein B7X61_06825 [Gallionellales bacterium 39-52-133]
MRSYRVLVLPAKGKQFISRLMEISSRRVVLRGEQMLPVGMLCDLQIIIPPLAERMPCATAELKAEVGEVIFSDGFIRLECRIKLLGNEARQLLDA